LDEHRQARRAERDYYRGDLVHDVIERLQCIEERSPIDEMNRIIGVADCGSRALDGRGNSAHPRFCFLCSRKFSGCIYSRDVCGIELVGWGFLVYSN